MKKILAFIMASVLALGVLTVAVSAEDVSEPAYTPVEYKIEDILAVVESGEDCYLQPTDIILLPVKDEQEETTEVKETAAPAVSDVLIVEYLPGQDAASGNKMTRFVDYVESGYAVLDIAGYPDYAYKGNERKTNYPIDFAHAEGYAFKQWKVESVYSGKEINRIILVAEWAVPELKGWAGYKEMMQGYIKTFIDKMISYMIYVFTRLAAFFV